MGKKDIKNGKITDIKNARITNDSKAIQLLFTQRVLFLIDEKNSFSSLKSEKRILPHFLLINEEEAKKYSVFYFI